MFCQFIIYILYIVYLNWIYVLLGNYMFDGGVIFFVYYVLYEVMKKVLNLNIVQVGCSVYDNWKMMIFNEDKI